MTARTGRPGFLTVENLRAGYRAGRVLHGVGLTVAEGEICAILGPNGAGKTSLLRALCGMIRTEGTLRFDGADLPRRRPEAVARMGVAHVPEGRGTFAPLTVEENLRLGAYTRRDRAGVRDDLERTYGYFPVLKERRGQAAGSLSGGEQQMVAIGRALMARPRLVLLDEPSLGLAPLVTRDLFRIVRAINEEKRTTVMLVEQNAHLTLEFAHRAHVLETGRIVLSGTAEEIRADERTARAYLGIGV
ncbi:High-affinity branched-chain amino acid transport ATP-binding protein LivF [Actinomadura rubteroloni]|uniref:High-affinity branched-chain amino acid transport ATP-binding protein LivF n=1 Tax=Actinomadura rubteroloni TaxID=1926885 RepID=A0A2P4UD98_9ACTN|nr:ABC transporter ATP-binding protein [Actinomadura rubteroloni]POM23033.1 High-affinity branched-chain amino acid transport ATP-binding protein LivF [Actinomadura rubteroloni]